MRMQLLLIAHTRISCHSTPKTCVKTLVHRCQKYYVGAEKCMYMYIHALPLVLKARHIDTYVHVHMYLHLGWFALG